MCCSLLKEQEEAQLNLSKVRTLKDPNKSSENLLVILHILYISWGNSMKFEIFLEEITVAVEGGTHDKLKLLLNLLKTAAIWKSYFNQILVWKLKFTASLPSEKQDVRLRLMDHVMDLRKIQRLIVNGFNYLKIQNDR